MAGELSIWHAGVYVENGVRTPWGSFVTPQKVVEVSAKLVEAPRVRTLAVGEKLHLWQYDADAPDWCYFAIWLPDQEGNIDVGFKYVLASDVTSNVRWRTHKLSCHSPLVMNEDEALQLASATDDVGETGGFPTVWAGSGLAAKCTDIAVMNPAAASAAVRVAYALIGGDGE